MIPAQNQIVHNLLPFIFALNPALILIGSPIEVVFAVTTVLMSAAFFSWAVESSVGAIPMTQAERIAALVLSLGIGSSTLAFGPASLANFAVLMAGGLLILAFSRFANGRVRAVVQA